MDGLLPRHLRILRAETGLTMTEAAKRIGMRRETLGFLERGEQKPHLATLSKIARFYKIPVAELMEDAENTPYTPYGSGPGATGEGEASGAEDQDQGQGQEPEESPKPQVVKMKGFAIDPAKKARIRRLIEAEKEGVLSTDELTEKLVQELVLK